VSRPLSGSVVVIAGASSGIGRATALAFADHGAHLVLAARAPEALHTVASACRARGATALVVPTDIGDPAQVDRLAERAVQAHGRIDTWVTTAAALLAGTFGDEPLDEIDTLVRTNVMGHVHTARTALAHFRGQHGGVLIQVSSMLGVVPNPVVPLYAMSKFAARGLALSLHHLTAAWPGVRVCVVLPGPVDTPMFERAANHTGRGLRAIAPAIAPERVAAAIVSCARRPRRQVPVGLSSRLVLAGERLGPRLTEWAVARLAAGLLLRPEPVADRAGTLLAPSPAAPGRVHGSWRHGRRRRGVGEAVGRAVARGFRRGRTVP
jgi:NAD(P)-dependent dehydrogenase (short-subunit alcohol dehydrogenase family)